MYKFMLNFIIFFHCIFSTLFFGSIQAKVREFRDHYLLRKPINPIYLFFLENKIYLRVVSNYSIEEFKADDEVMENRVDG